MLKIIAYIYEYINKCKVVIFLKKLETSVKRKNNEYIENSKNLKTVIILN